MKRFIYSLIILLSLSNLYFLQNSFSEKRRFQEVVDREKSENSQLKMLMGALPKISERLEKKKILAIMVEHSYEKLNIQKGKVPKPATSLNGCWLVNGISFKFDQSDRLIQVSNTPCLDRKIVE